MPEEVVPPAAESLGWRAGLPDDLKKNETFAQYKTVGDFAKSHLEVTQKYSDLEKKLGDYVPKLPDDASDEERGLYLDALGRPKTASEYEFDGEDKNAPEWTDFWKQQMHSMGLTKAQAKTLSGSFNGQIQKMVEAHNNSMKAEMTAAEQKLKSEWGDKFDTNVELAKRLYQKHLGAEFDKDFSNGNGQNRFSMVKYLVKLAALTGEDRSPQAGFSQTSGKGNSFIDYSKSPEPPRK